MTLRNDDEFPGGRLEFRIDPQQPAPVLVSSGTSLPLGKLHATNAEARPLAWLLLCAKRIDCTGARSPSLRATTCRVSGPRRRRSMMTSDSIGYSPGCGWSRNAWGLAG